MSKKLANMNPRKRVKWLARQIVNVQVELEDDTADVIDAPQNKEQIALREAYGKLTVAYMALHSAIDDLGYYRTYLPTLHPALPVHKGPPMGDLQPAMGGTAYEPVIEMALGQEYGHAFRNGDVVRVKDRPGAAQWVGSIGVVQGTYEAPRPFSEQGGTKRYYRCDMSSDEPFYFDFTADELERVPDGMMHDDPPTIEITRDMLLLAGVRVGTETIKNWTDAQRTAAWDWAAAAHLRASDNDGVSVPPRPAWVVAAPEAEL